MVYKTRDECIQKHIKAYRKRLELEKELIPKIGEEEFNRFFAEYEKLGIKPMHVFKKGLEHRIAAQALENCILTLKNSEAYQKCHIKNEQVLTPKQYIEMAAV